MSYLCYLSMRRFATLSTSFRSSPSQTRRQYRHFSTTIRRAEEKPPTAQMTAVMKELSQTKLFKEIQNNEELLSSIQDAVQILEEEGFDPRNRLHMLKLVTNPRIREKMERVGKAIQEAGIDPAEAKEVVDLVRSRILSQ